VPVLHPLLVGRKTAWLSFILGLLQRRRMQLVTS
jgi:hypothetical protein